MSIHRIKTQSIPKNGWVCYVAIKLQYKMEKSNKFDYK